MARFIVWILSLLGLAAGGAIVGYFALALLVPRPPETAGFGILEDLVIYNVDDVGLADLNGDGQLDRWTTNHSAAQWITLDGRRIDAADIGLAQDMRLPGFEAGSGPIPEGPVRLYMDDSHFIIDTSGIGDTVIEGTFTIPWRTQAGASGGATAQVSQCDTGPKCHRVTFAVPDGGRLWVEPIPAPSDGFEIAIAFAPDTDMTQVQIGSQALRAAGPTLFYASRDRHGLALADLDSDSTPEIFVSRGGARGELIDIEPDAQDEFFDWQDGQFTDRIDETGIAKAGCPGRQTAWVDINSDGALDLYQVCGRAAGANDADENRLYIAENSRYSERAAAYGLNLTGLGSFRFFRDTTPDAPLSMLWAAPDALALYRQDPDSGTFTQAWQIPRLGGNLDKIVLSDLDGDGAWEALIASSGRSLFVRPTPDSAQRLDLAQYGLPETFADVHVLDADSDGRLDVFAPPHGLYLGQEDGRFAVSPELDTTWVGASLRFAWYDADSDGDLDLWLLKLHGAQFPRPVLSIYNRLPLWAQTLLDTRYGKGALRRRYWSSVLYENRLDQTGRVETVAITDDAGRPLAPGTPVAVTLDSGETRWHLTGETDSARLSSTRLDIAVPLPDGRMITGVRALDE